MSLLSGCIATKICGTFAAGGGDDDDMLLLQDYGVSGSLGALGQPASAHTPSSLQPSLGRGQSAPASSATSAPTTRVAAEPGQPLAQVEAQSGCAGGVGGG